MIDQLEIISLKGLALKDSEYFTRKICRYYSENFNTPLIEVHELPWPFVFQNYIEHIIEKNNSREEIYDLILEICYPEKVQDDEEELNEWIKNIEIEEESKRRAQKIEAENKVLETDIIPQNPHNESDPQEEVDEVNMQPSSFSHLEDEMKEDE